MSIDFDKISQSFDAFLKELLSHDTPWQSFWFLFTHGGWILVLITFLWGFKEVWVYWRQIKYECSQKYVLLAIDVPRENEQGPKAVENIFSHVHGSYKKPNLIEKYWDGFLTPKFSFELISLGGYLQFLIRTPVLFRDLVESAIYAQYPDSEITEVEDYAASAPTRFKNTENNMWGCEFVLYNKDFYPIRTYPAFEYGLTQEFKDPMASTLEFMGKIAPEENIWLQLVITPIPDKWTKKGVELVKKLIGAKIPEKKPGFLYSATAGVARGVWETATYTLRPPVSEKEKKQQQEQRSEMLYLSPGEKTAVEAIETKISKNAFDTKFRFIYWGKCTVFSRQKGVNGILGAIAQINSLDMNGFKPHPKTKTTIDYFFKKTRIDWRQQKLMRGYKARSNWRGWGHSILNIEEIATLWHFPMMDIRTPMLKKTQAKRMESPFSLPIESPSLENQSLQDSGLTPTPTPTPTEIPIQPPVQPSAQPEPSTEFTRRSPEQLRGEGEPPTPKVAPPSNLPVG